MIRNLGKTMIIYDIPGIVRQAWPISVTPANILSGFSCTGIVPFNGNIFNDSDFAPSRLTDGDMCVNAILNENSRGSNVSTLPQAPDINNNNVSNRGTKEIPQKES